MVGSFVNFDSVLLWFERSGFENCAVFLGKILGCTLTVPLSHGGNPAMDEPPIKGGGEGGGVIPALVDSCYGDRRLDHCVSGLERS